MLILKSTQFVCGSPPPPVFIPPIYSIYGGKGETICAQHFSIYFYRSTAAPVQFLGGFRTDSNIWGSSILSQNLTLFFIYLKEEE